MNKFDQRKIINILFVAAVLILTANLILTKFFIKKNNLNQSELSSAEIDSTFRLALLNLGVQQDWNG